MIHAIFADVVDHQGLETERAAIARLHTLIEPALTLVVGVFLGWVVIATLQPLYALIGEAL